MVTEGQNYISYFWESVTTFRYFAFTFSMTVIVLGNCSSKPQKAY